MESPSNVIHIDADGNAIQLPQVTQNPPGGLSQVQHIDESGNPIQLNLPPKGSQDVTEPLPTAQQIGTNIIKPLPALGAAGFTALVPEVPGASGLLGAAAGSSVQNFLKRYRPDIFTENGKTPTGLDEAQNIAQNAGMEGTGQLLAKAGPEAARLIASGVSKLPAFSKAIETENLAGQQVQGVEKLKSLAKRGGVSGAGIDEPKSVEEILDKVQKGNTINLDKMNDLLGDPKYRGLISDGTRENLKTIGKILNDLDSKLNPDEGPKNIYMQGGKLLLKYGTGITASSALGIPHPGLIGSAAVGALEIPPKLISKIASNPAATKALVGLANPQTPPAVAKLYQQGLLSYIRGEEMYHQSSSGEREKVTISDQGVPQIPHE